MTDLTDTGELLDGPPPLAPGPRPVVILETLTGATLAYLIDTAPRRLAISDIVHLGFHLCSALHYLHRHAVLHLDLKPSNIVSESRLAKIIDLSIARPPGRGRAGAGTTQYMAPEQVTGDYLGLATDVWGVGAVLWEAATGEEPFNADDEDDDEPSY
jgi:eukaryotic-like serine/threonine-protein kinase